MLRDTYKHNIIYTYIHVHLHTYKHNIYIYIIYIYTFNHSFIHSFIYSYVHIIIPLQWLIILHIRFNQWFIVYIAAPRSLTSWFHLLVDLITDLFLMLIFLVNMKQYDNNYIYIHKEWLYSGLSYYNIQRMTISRGPQAI